jgi:hypothetical protein
VGTTRLGYMTTRERGPPALDTGFELAGDVGYPAVEGLRERVVQQGLAPAMHTSCAIPAPILAAPATPMVWGWGARRSSWRETLSL